MKHIKSSVPVALILFSSVGFANANAGAPERSVSGAPAFLREGLELVVPGDTPTYHYFSDCKVPNERKLRFVWQRSWDTNSKIYRLLTCGETTWALVQLDGNFVMVDTSQTIF